MTAKTHCSPEYYLIQLDIVLSTKSRTPISMRAPQQSHEGHLLVAQIDTSTINDNTLCSTLSRSSALEYTIIIRARSPNCLTFPLAYLPTGSLRADSRIVQCPTRWWKGHEEHFSQGNSKNFWNRIWLDPSRWLLFPCLYSTSLTRKWEWLPAFQTKEAYIGTRWLIRTLWLHQNELW